MVKSAAASVLKDELSPSVSHVLIIYNNHPVLLLVFLIVSFHHWSVPSEHQRTVTAPYPGRLVSRRCDSLWVTLWWGSLNFQHYFILAVFHMMPLYYLAVSCKARLYLYANVSFCVWWSLQMEQIQLNPSLVMLSCWYPLQWILGKRQCWEGIAKRMYLPFNSVAFWLCGVAEALIQLRAPAGWCSTLLLPSCPCRDGGRAVSFLWCSFHGDNDRGTNACTNPLAQPVNSLSFKQRQSIIGLKSKQAGTYSCMYSIYIWRHGLLHSLVFICG